MVFAAGNSYQVCVGVAMVITVQEPTLLLMIRNRAIIKAGGHLQENIKLIGHSLY